MVTRRALIGSTLVGTVLAGLPRALAFGWRGEALARNSVAADGFAGLIDDLSAARIIGQYYRAQRPDEADRDRLTTMVFGRGCGPAEGRSAQRQFLRGCQRDFRNGDIVILDGWILARTEARICLLAALT